MDLVSQQQIEVILLLSVVSFELLQMVKNISLMLISISRMKNDCNIKLKPMIFKQHNNRRSRNASKQMQNKKTSINYVTYLRVKYSLYFFWDWQFYPWLFLFLSTYFLNPHKMLTTIRKIEKRKMLRKSRLSKGNIKYTRCPKKKAS